MNLVGLEVKTVTKEHGIVVDNVNGVITVRLASGNTARYIYPDAFEKKFLVPIDEKNEQCLMAMFRCDLCGTENVKTERMNDLRVCEKCRPKMGRLCKVCGRYHTGEFVMYNFDPVESIEDVGEDDECIVYDYDYDFICPDCEKNRVFKCNQCSDRWLLDEESEKKGTCRCCYNSKTKCNGCNKIVLARLGEQKDYGFYCQECIQTATKKCPRCSKEYIGKIHRYCEECREFYTYYDKLKALALNKKTYIRISDLRYVNCKELFDHLDSWSYMFSIKDSSPYPVDYGEFQYIVLQNFGFSMIVVPVHNLLRCVNLSFTKTEYVSKGGQMEVYSEIKSEYRDIKEKIDSSAGKILVLNTPIELRVQTYGDMHYGKKWDGRGNYVQEGNNYGDTSSFYIIGILEKNRGPL